MYDALMVCFSNAGTSRSVVLRDVRDIAHESVDSPDAQWFVAEWSAKPKAKLDDPEAFAMANPSAGYLPGMTIAGLMQTAREAKNKRVERIEVLCQWVTQAIEPYIDPTSWQALQVDPADLVIPAGARTVWGVDTSSDRSTTWISAAVMTSAGKPLVTVRVKRPGIVWAVKYLAELAEESGHHEVALQAQGCPVIELIDPLEEAGLIVHKMDRPTCAVATGRLHDRVRDADMVLTSQPDVDLAIEGGMATKYSENRLWSLEASTPVDIAGVRAQTWALYALDELAPPPKRPAPPPPRAVVLDSDIDPSDDMNIATAAF